MKIKWFWVVAVLYVYMVWSPFIIFLFGELNSVSTISSGIFDKILFGLFIFPIAVYGFFWLIISPSTENIFNLTWLLFGSFMFLPPLILAFLSDRDRKKKQIEQKKPSA